jgi:DNA-binding NtrC family response regulator
MSVSSNRFNVLLVDDEVDLLSATQDALASYFASVFTASSVVAALEVLSKEKIDIVLCDFNMPNHDGLMLRNIIVDDYPHVRFALLTGYGDDPRVIAASKLNQFPVLDKPMRPDVLANRLLSMIFSPELAKATETNYLATLSDEEREHYEELSLEERRVELVRFSSHMNKSSKARMTKKG